MLENNKKLVIFSILSLSLNIFFIGLLSGKLFKKKSPYSHHMSQNYSDHSHKKMKRKDEHILKKMHLSNRNQFREEKKQKIQDLLYLLENNLNKKPIDRESIKKFLIKEYELSNEYRKSFYSHISNNLNELNESELKILIKRSIGSLKRYLKE